MFVDRATIYIRSGKGGHGCLSFCREKYRPKGGPDGGDGGNGGDVILQGDRSLTTLQPLTPRPHYRAEHGKPGQGSSKFGASAENLIVKIPPGTLVYDAETEELLADITADGQQYVAAAGGVGGFGNEHYKGPQNQAPREFTPGEPSVECRLRLELKLIADVGFIGLPNAGKSTLLRSVTRADPRVADYPFTTLSPHLGIAELPAERRLVLADLPGLIEGAAAGAGLGHHFLRHVERTRLLLHVIDICPVDGSDPAAAYRMIRGELAAYSAALAETSEVIAINKVDLLAEDDRDDAIAALREELNAGPETPVVVISGATGLGVGPMLETCYRSLGDRPSSGWFAGG